MWNWHVVTKIKIIGLLWDQEDSFEEMLKD